MEMTEIHQNLDEFVRTELMGNRRSEPIRPDEELLETGMIDSIGFFKLLSFITERFGINHNDEELVPDNFRTLGVISKRIAEKLKTQSGEAAKG